MIELERIQRRIEIDKKFGYYVFGGLLIGAIFGSGIGSANGIALTGIGVGALIGVFLGWFIAAAAIEINKKREINKDIVMNKSTYKPRPSTGWVWVGVPGLILLGIALVIVENADHNFKPVGVVINPSRTEISSERSDQHEEKRNRKWIDSQSKISTLQAVWM